MFQNTFIAVLDMSIAASIAAVLIIFFRWIFSNKLPRILIYALWAIVLVRLLIPFSLPSMFDIFNVSSVPEIIMTQSLQHNEVVDDIPDGTGHGSISQDKIVGETLSDNINSVSLTPNPTASADPMQILIFVISWIWFAGMAAFFLFSMFAYFHTRNILKTAVLCKCSSWFSEYGQKLKLKRKVQIYTSDRIDTPVVCGLIQPRIVLPLTLEQDCNESELKHIITHELVHIKRFDYLIKPLSVLALFIHWFNPIIWFSFILSQKDMEMACDERVMYIYDGDEKSEYAASLIKLAVKQNILLNGGLLAFGESNIKSRIKGILNFRKHRFWAGAVIFTAIIAIAVVLLTNGQTIDANKKGLPEIIEQKDNNDNIKPAANINVAEPFEIYMIKENADENLGLNDIPLDDKPVIGEEQLTAYYWDRHILKVKKGEYLERIRKYTPLSGKPFVLVSNGKRLYKGYFWTSLSSVSFPETPLIDIDGVRNEEELYIHRERDEVLLQLTLPPNIKDHQELLNQAELFDALKESGKLVEASTPPEESKKAYNIDMSKTEKVTIEYDGKVIQTITGATELKNFSFYLHNMTLLPNDNKIRENRSSVVKFKLWNKDGTQESYNTVYDSLYDLGYIDINGMKVRADLDFFRLLKSYSRYPGLSYDVPADVRNLFKNYGWTVSFKVNEMREKLPSDLTYQAGEFPIKIYWAYNFTLSSAIGLSDLYEYLGKTVNVEIYRLNEGLPEEFEPNIEARGIVIRNQGEIIGAYMDRGRHSSFACSLDRKTLEQATGKDWSDWLVSYIDFDNKLVKELKSLNPEEVIKTSFNALDKGDYKRYYATFTLRYLVSYLSTNVDFSDLYNKKFPNTNVNKAKLLNIGNSRDENNYKMYPVEVDFDFKKMITSEDGQQLRFVGIEKEVEDMGWRISGIGTGP